MKRIVLSLGAITFVAALAVSATGAFFSDTETSTGNTFTAGAIDLKIDNTSYATDYTIPGFQNPTGALAASAATTWDLRDLTVEKFFNFVDLKPGDIGEDTISVHVNNNPAWLCAAAQVTSNADNSCTSPEYANDPLCGQDDANTNGDLASQVHFAFWKDDGDNVLEVGETPFLTGSIADLGTEGKIALADSSGSAVLGNSPIDPNSDTHIGKAWCFGTLTPNPVPNDSNTDPVTRGSTGFTCDGSQVDNAAQTDSVTGDLQFYAVQSRNNSAFTCADNYIPVWPLQS